MTLRSSAAALLAVVATLAAAVPASAGAPRARTLAVGGEVQSLGMDGPLVGVATRSPGACDPVLAWNVLTGSQVKVSGGATCGEGPTSTGGGVAQVAVAGRRLAWIVNQGGNTESFDQMFTASLPRPSERRVLQEDRLGSVDGGWLRGGWAGGLVGDGSTLALATWQTTFEDPANCSETNEHPTAPCHLL